MSRFDEEPDGDPHGECALEIRRLRAHLGNLLAVLHGDGGHYLDEHGMDKAVADALTRYYSNIMAADSKITALGEKVRVLREALESIANIAARRDVYEIARAALEATT